MANTFKQRRPSGSPSVIQWWATLAACTLLGWCQASGQDYQTTLQQGERAWAKGQYAEAKVRFQEALRLAQARVSTDPADRMRIALLAGNAFIMVGEFDNAKNAADFVLALPQAETAGFKLGAACLAGDANAGLVSYEQALNNYTAAIDLARRSPGAANSGLARCLVSRADLYRILGRDTEAGTDLADAAAIVKQGGATPPDAAQRLTVQGDLERGRERFTESRARYSEAEAAWSAMATDQNPGLARTLIGEGEIFLIEGELKAAEQAFNRAERLINKLTSNPVYATASDAMGRLELAKGNLKPAEDMLRDMSYQMRQLNLKERHPDIAASRDHVGRLYLAQGKPKEAEENLRAAEKTRRSALGPNHPDLAETLVALGSLYRRQRRFDEAERSLAEALRIQTARLGNDSLAAAATRSEQGNLSSDRHQNTEAAELYRRALAIQAQRLDAGHPLRLATARRLAMTLHAMERDAEAEPLLQEWMKHRGNASADPERLEALQLLASIHLTKKQYPEAEKEFRALLAERKPAAGPGASTALIERDLADALYGQQKLREAASFYESAAPKLPPAESAQAWERLGEILVQQKRVAEAVKPYQQALEIRQKALPAGDPEIARGLMVLSGALLDAGRDDQAERYLSQWLNLPARSGAQLSSDEMRYLDRVAQRMLDTRQFAKAEVYLRRELKSLDWPDAPADALNKVLPKLADACAGQGKNKEAADLYERRARRDYAARRPGEAERHFVLARDLRLRAQGPDSLDLVTTLLRLGDAYLDQMKFDEANRSFQDARDILDRRGATDDPRLAASLNGLGEVAQARHAFPQASDLYEQADRELQKLKNPPRQVQAAVLFNRGNLAAAKNQTEEALRLFERCLDLTKGIVSAEDPPPLQQLDRIADFYKSQGRTREAEELYRNTLDLRRKAFGAGSEEEAWGLQSLAEFYVSSKRDPEAAEVAERALAIFQVKAGPDSEEVRVVLRSLGTVYQRSGNTARAIEAVERSLGIGERSGRLSRQEEHGLRGQLGQYYRARGDYAGAVRNYRRMADLWQPEGMADPNLQTAMRLLAISYEDAKDHRSGQEAYDQLHKALKTQRSDDFRLMNDYADALRRNGYKAAADKLQREASKLDPKPSGPARR